MWPTLRLQRPRLPFNQSEVWLNGNNESEESAIKYHPPLISVDNEWKFLPDEKDDLVIFLGGKYESSVDLQL